MPSPKSTSDPIILDGNEAAASIAFKTSEVIAIYPITPSSTMGELSDEWASQSQKNIWGVTPLIQEMQSEAGVAGVVHGALQRGALTTTFTASQGLLLMIPNMYKISGELTPAVFHVAARSLAAHALSIFGDHSDVMAARSAGFAQICSNSVQEAQDIALIAHSTTLKARIPFIHFFDGFRTSHEIGKIEGISNELISKMIDETMILEHRARALSPDRPVIRGTAQNPDVYFQSRETGNLYYKNCPALVQKAMDQFFELTGRRYGLFEYVGDPQADRVVILMGSAAQTCEETIDVLKKSGQKIGIVKVRLYRPFDVENFLKVLPKTVQSIAVLDRTKEPGAIGEPLYQDVISALYESGWKNNSNAAPRVIGGRYGLSSKEFTPGMAKAVFDELSKQAPKNHFTVGINDDVSHTSLVVDKNFIIEDAENVRAVFYGLGADGTVGANKSSIKIIGENTPLSVQGYFVYDSKKSGSMTISHLRFGKKAIRSPYLVERASFIACHQFEFIQKIDVLETLDKNGIFLLNSPYGPERVWDELPVSTQKRIIDQKAKVYVIDALDVARKTQMGGRVNTIMQTCFFAISGVLPKEQAIEEIKKSIKKTYAKKGDEVLRMNFEAVDQTLAALFEVKIPAKVTAKKELAEAVSAKAPDFVKNVTAMMLAGKGNELPVSCLPVDGTYPSATSRWEKRSIAQSIPVWDADVCIQCAKCVIVCPHAVIRAKVYDKAELQDAPDTFKTTASRNSDWSGKSFTLQVAPEDCTGCGICVDVCPAKNKSETRLKAINMEPFQPIVETEKKNWDFFLKIPEMDRRTIDLTRTRSSQMLEPLFEFSGACGGCGETPYLKLLTQLFGDRMMVANATGCSSIYGGNLPTTPWAKDKNGRGPAWANSLFEDNAEFGLGFRLAINQQIEYAHSLLVELEADLGREFILNILNAPQGSEADIYEQRSRVEALKDKLSKIKKPQSARLSALLDVLVKKSVWIIGGDGWAYDIGFGGLDHVLASGHNVNILVLDTEVYSNTGGQSSKSTPRGAVAKFAAGGKALGKKDLARMAMTYDHVYVASVAMGAKDEHTIKSFLEAEAYDGPSLVIAYSHCIAHGINMTTAMQDQKIAVDSGYWPLFRRHPLKALEGKPSLELDSADPKTPLKDYWNRQNRFKILSKTKPEEAAKLLEMAQGDIKRRYQILKDIAKP